MKLRSLISWTRKVLPQPAAPARGKPRRSFRLTLEGLLWLVFALFMLYQGWLRSFNLISLIASLLFALWLLNALSVAFRFRGDSLQLQRRLDGFIFARQPFSVTLHLTNRTRRVQAGLRIVDCGACNDHSWFLPVLKPSEACHNRYQATIPCRGRYVWSNLFVNTSHPFGLARKTLTFGPVEETIVLPRLGRLQLDRLQRLLLNRMDLCSMSVRAARRHPTAQTEFHGLREFRSGDSLRMIHWKTSARVGEPMVRDFEEPPSNSLLVILEPGVDQESGVRSQGSGMRSQESGEPGCVSARSQHELLEKAVSLAATVCWEWGRQPGAEIGLVIAENKPDLQITQTGRSRVLPLLEKLALVQGDEDIDWSMLLDCLRTSPLPAGPILLVSTRSSGLEAALAAALHHPVTLINVADPSLKDLFELEETDLEEVAIHLEPEGART